MKFSNLQISKILNTNINRIFLIPFKVRYISLRCTYSEKQKIFWKTDFRTFHWKLRAPASQVREIEFRNLQISKILNTDINRIFLIPFKVRYISLRCTYFENNSGVSRSGYLYGVNQKLSLTKLSFFFVNWRYSSEIWKNKNKNP